jgi:hypothetical protein
MILIGVGPTTLTLDTDAIVSPSPLSSSLPIVWHYRYQQYPSGLINDTIVVYGSETYKQLHQGNYNVSIQNRGYICG